MAILPPITALGTQFLIEIWDNIEATKLEMVYDRLEFLLTEFENKYSRFKPDSLISQLNIHKIIHNPSPELINILTLGITFYDHTNGIHNLMVGETLVATGYDAEYSLIAKTALPQIPNPHSVLDIQPDYITLRHGMIDIGGYGKGVVIDLLATTLAREFGLQYYLINGGGDMYGTSNHSEPITLFLEHPTEPNTYLGTTIILNQGFAASSRHKRSWVHNQTHFSHIIETEPKQTAERIDASFITASTATTADVFATVALIAAKQTMNEFATTHELGVATLTLPSSFMYSRAFIFNSL